MNRAGEFIAFGSKALDLYYQQQDGFLLFDKFKMGLHRSDIRNSMAIALNGKKRFFSCEVLQGGSFMKH